MKSTRSLALLAAGVLASWGCGAPLITAAYPPGFEPPPVELADDEQAQALGEQAALGNTQPPGATPATSSLPSNPPTEPGQEKTTPSGLKYTTLKPGQGPEATAGKRVRVHYVGTLTSGKKFDSSRDRGEPFQFLLGGGEVIQGWDQGVSGMKVGELRKLVIPSELGYGSQGAGQDIPPNATLVFEVELLGIE